MVWGKGVPLQAHVKHPFLLDVPVTQQVLNRVYLACEDGDCGGSGDREIQKMGEGNGE